MTRLLQKIITTSLMMVLIVPLAFGQDHQKVTIEDGKVFVNGKEVLKGDLPESLRNVDVNARFSFWSTDNAFIEINGNVFTFEDGRVTEADEDFVNANNAMVYFSTNESDFPVRLFQRTPADFSFIVAPKFHAQAMDTYMAAFSERALKFDKLRFELAEIAPESDAIARQLVVEAENAARMVSSLPRVEFESYMGRLQGRDLHLYGELLRENEMENQTHHLAMQILQAENRADQEKLTDELRKTLIEIFQLKQENRRNEIDQLAIQLKDLQGRLEERKSLQEDIIESRLKDLLERHRW